MTELFLTWRRRRDADRHIEAQIAAMAGELIPDDAYAPMQSFLDAERDQLSTRVFRLQTEIEERSVAVQEYERSIAVLNAEMSERNAVIGALQKALADLTEAEFRDTLPIAAE